eukprot:565733_1
MQMRNMNCMMSVAFLLATLHVIEVYCDLSECNHLKYSTGEVVVINHCLDSSVDGIITSRIISSDESGYVGPVFTEKIYGGIRCDAKEHLSTQQIPSTEIVSFNIQTGKRFDCTQIFRVFDMDSTTDTCARGPNFEDIGVIRGYRYQSDDESDTEYDCFDKGKSVTITDCLTGAQAVFTSGNCVEDEYFDNLLYCGPAQITPTTTTQPPVPAVVLWPGPPAPSTTTTTTTTTKTTQTSTSADIASPTIPNEDFIYRFPSTSHDIETSVTDAPRGNQSSNLNASDVTYKIYVLPALPIQGLCFLITLVLLILCLYYLFCHEESKQIDVLLKSFIIFTFIFNVLGIACILTFSFIMHLFAWTSDATREMALMFYYGASVCYVLGKFCLEFVFLLRVYTAFRNNIFRISNSVLYSLFCWMFMCCALWLLLLISEDRHWSASHYLYIVATVSDVILVVVLLYMFTVRLQTLVIRETVAMRDVPRRKSIQPATHTSNNTPCTVGSTKTYTPTSPALGSTKSYTPTPASPALATNISSTKSYPSTPALRLASTSSTAKMDNHLSVTRSVSIDLQNCTTPTLSHAPQMSTSHPSTKSIEFPRTSMSIPNNTLPVIKTPTPLTPIDATKTSDLQKSNTPTLTPLPTLSHTSQMSTSHPSTKSGEFPRTSMSMADSMQFRISCVLDANDLLGIKSDLHSNNSSLISLMTKLVLLSSISLITTVIFGVYIFAEVSMKDKLVYIPFALWCIDMCTNSICLFLNFGFSNAIYQKLCTRPHAMTQWVIETIFITKIVIKEARKEGI